MAWETRGGRGRYYTRSRREGGRMVREYVGSGALAEAMAGLDGLDTRRRAEERQEEQEQRREEAAIERAVIGFCAEVESVLRAALTAAGYHRHDRGRWRKRRGKSQDGDGTDAGGDGAAGAGAGDPQGAGGG